MVVEPLADWVLWPEEFPLGPLVLFLAGDLDRMHDEIPVIRHFELLAATRQLIREVLVAQLQVRRRLELESA